MELTIFRLCLGPSNKPFVLYGAGGSGKTAMLSMTACKSVQEWLQPAKPLLIVRWALWESRLEANGELNSRKQILTFVGIATDTSEPHLTQVHWLLSSHQFVNSCRTLSCFHSRTFRMTSYPWQLTWKNFSTRYNFAFLEVFEMNEMKMYFFCLRQLSPNPSWSAWIRWINWLVPRTATKCHGCRQSYLHTAKLLCLAQGKWI